MLRTWNKSQWVEHVWLIQLKGELSSKVTAYLSDIWQRFHTCPVRITQGDVYHFLVRLSGSLQTGGFKAEVPDITTQAGQPARDSFYLSELFVDPACLSGQDCRRMFYVLHIWADLLQDRHLCDLSVRAAAGSWAELCIAGQLAAS